MHFFSLLLGLVCASSPPSVFNRPVDIELRENFGLAPTEGTVTHTFNLDNNSNRPIRVLDYRVTCGCLSATLPDGAIPAGQAGKVSLSLSTRGLHGQVTQAVALRTDHPTKPVVRLVLTGVVTSVWAQPSAVDLGTIERGQIPTREVGLLAAGLSGIKVKSAKAADPDIVSVELLPAYVDEKSKQRSVEALGKLIVTWTGRRNTLGALKTEVIVTTDHTTFHTIRVPMTAHISGTSRLSPSQALFGAVAPGGSVSRTITVQLDEMVKADELRLTADHEHVVAVVDTVDPKTKIARIRITAKRAAGIADASSAGLIRGQVIGTKDSKRIFSIPYIGVCLR